MPSYTATIANMQACHPSLFPTEAHARHHLFFVNGNGFEWVGGKLQSIDGRRDPAEVQQELPPARPLQTLYPLYALSKLVTIPDDVQSDWLAAARAAMLWGWVVRHTAEDARWLRHAAARIATLEEKGRGTAVTYR